MAKTTIWNGASADWSVAADWSNGLPNGAADVVVSAPATPSGLYTLTISAPQTARSLTINDPNATVADQGALSISGKNALTVSAGVFQLDHGGSVVGGTLSATGGAFQWNGGTLINSSYQGVLDLSANNASLNVVGGLTFVGATTANPATLNVTGLNAGLTFVGTQTLSREIINLSNSSGVYGPSYLESDDANGLGATLTLANTVTVNSYDNAIIAFSDGANDVFVNAGAINALEQPQGSLIIEGFDGSAPVLNTFKNTGALNITGTLTPGGPVNLGSAERVFVETGNFLNSGQVTIGGNSVLNVMLGRQGIPNEQNAVTAGGQATNSGTITLQDGGFLQVAGNFTNSGYIYVRSSDDPTKIEIDNVAPLVNKGHVILSDNANNLIYGAILATGPVTPPGGGPTDTNGGPITPTGGGPTNTGGGPGPTSGGGIPTSPGGVVAGGVPASFDNFGTLSGAGQIGKGDKALALANFGTIDANGIQTLVLDTGLMIGSVGLVEALGFGGITLEDSLATDGGSVKVAAISKLNLDGASLLGGNITNQGLLEATGGAALPSQIALASVSNTGTLEAANGTTLTLAGDTVTGAGTILASDPVVATPSTILLEGTTINGGRLQTLNGGVITTVAGDSLTVLNNVTIAAGATVTDALGSTLTLKGTIKLASANGEQATIQDGANLVLTPPPGAHLATGVNIAGSVTLQGGGILELSLVKSDGSHTFGDVFASSANAQLTNQATIQGAGDIGVGVSYDDQGVGSYFGAGNLTLSNAGVIDADAFGIALRIGTGNIVANSGTIEATLGGLIIEDAVANTSNGLVKDASEVDLKNGASITGGKVTILAGGTLETGDPSAASAIDNAVIGNAGTLEALAGATLTLQGDTINGAGTLLASDPVVTPSTLDLVSTTINGGTLKTLNGGMITTVADDNGTVLNNVTIADGTTVKDANGSTLGLKGTITLAGVGATIQEDGTFSYPPIGQTWTTGINTVGSVTLKGAGSIDLNNSSSSAIYSNAPGSTLTNVANITGSGTIGYVWQYTTTSSSGDGIRKYNNYLKIVNKGTINGDITINTGNIIQNNGSIGSDLTYMYIVDEVDGGGLIYVDNGAYVTVSTVSGATLSTSGDGYLHVDGPNGASALKNVTILAGTTANVDGAEAHLEGNINIKATSAGVGAVNASGNFLIDQTVNFLGGGRFHMGVRFSSPLTIDAFAQSTLNNRDIVDGFGMIGQVEDGSAANLTLVNSATIDADAPFDPTYTNFDNPTVANALVIDTGNTVNNAGGLLEATNGGKLIVDDAVQFGSAKVASGSTLEFGAGASFLNIGFDNTAGDTGTLELDQPGALAISTIAGFLSDGAGHSDVIDLGGLSASDSWSFTENVAGNQGVLSIHDANHGVINLLLGGHYLAGGHSTSSTSSSLFSLATDGGTGAFLTTSAHS